MSSLVCDHCDEECENTETVENESICSYCHGSVTSTCVGCGERFFDEGMEYIQDDYWCQGCHADNFYCCSHCGESTNSDDCRHSGNENVYCNSCYDDVFTECSGCSGELHIELSRSDIEGDPWCEICYNETYCLCYNCGCEIAIGDHREDSDGDTWCEECFRGDEWSSGRDIIGRRFNRTGSIRRYGVELESSNCPDYTSLEGNTVFGACEDGTSGVEKEFYSPILQGDEGLEVIDSLCYSANDLGWKVDGTCGYHLHIDCTDLNEYELKAVAAGYAGTYKIWASFVPKSRRENTYCKPHSYRMDWLGDVDFNFFVSNSARDRYCWANWKAYQAHETLEIRLHTGTFNGRKVCNWIIAHIRFVDWCAQLGYDEVVKRIRGAQEISNDAVFRLLASIWDDKELRDYYSERARKFGTEYNVNTYSEGQLHLY